MNRSVLPAVVLVFLGALLWQQRAVAQTVHYVDNIRTCDGLTPCYPAIMDAVAAAAGGDTIAVFPGVYHETVVLAGKDGIVLKAHDEALPPVIAATAGASNAVEIAASTGVEVRRFLLEAPEAAGVAVNGGGSSGTVIQGNVVLALAGLTLKGSTSCTASGNTILGGGIALTSGNRCFVEGNTVEGAGITLGGDPSGVKHTVLQQNLVRGGGISLSGKNLKGNTVEANVVSGSAGDGILLRVTNGGPGNVVQDNTSIESASHCDIDDRSSGLVHNTWANNRFATKCGAASE